MLSFPAPFEPAGQRLALTLLHATWQGFAAVGLLALILRLCVSQSAAFRHGLCALTLAVLTVCPVVTWVTLGPAADAVAEPASSGIQPLAESAPRAQTDDHIQTNQEPVAQPPPAPTVTLAERWRTAAPSIVCAWLAGVMLLGLRLLAGVVGVVRLRRSSRPLPADWTVRFVSVARRLGFRVPPMVALSGRATQALAMGVLRPLVLLPAVWISELPADVVEAIIAHELAHLRRWDLWVNLWLRVVETVLFFHPAVWWLSRRLRAERELCCDELAAGAAGRATVARALEAVASLGLAPPPLAVALHFGRQPITLLARVRYLLGQAPAPRPAGRWLAGLLALFVPVAVWLTAGDVPPKPAETAVGLVVDVDGKPVAGIDVKAFDENERELPDKLRSDDRGQIRVPASWVRCDYNAGDDRVSLLARTADRVGWHSFFQSAHKPVRPEAFRITLQPLTRAVTGTFVDVAGKPLAGVRVGVWMLHSEVNGWIMSHQSGPDRLIPGVTSDASGRFRILLPPASAGELENRYTDYSARRIPFTKDKDDLGPITLAPAGRIAGTVFDSRTDKPVSGERILARGFGTDDLIHVGHGFATTGPDGRYAINGLLPAGYEVQVLGAEGDPKLVAPPQTVRVTAGSTRTANLTMAEGRPLRGTVIDAQTGQPIPFCPVTPGSRTDAQGRFQSYQPPGVYQAYIADGRRQHSTESSRNVEVVADRDPEPIILKAGPKYEDSRRGIMRMSVPMDNTSAAQKDESYKLRLTFRTPDNRPVTDTTIWTAFGDSDFPSMSSIHQGDSFVLGQSLSRDGQQVRLIIEPKGFARPKLVTVTIEKEMKPIKVDLKPAEYVTARGRVLDDQGKPIAGARVRVGLWQMGRSYETPWGPEPSTDADGRYELKHIRVDDRFRVEVIKEGYARAVSPRLQADAGAVVVVPDLRLGAGARSVTGTVTDPSGHPVANARIYATTPAVKETRSDAAGKFTLAGLPADVTKFWIDAPGFIVSEPGVPATDKPLNITLNRLDQDAADYRLSVRLKPQDGGEVKKWTMWVRQKPPSLEGFSTERSGPTFDMANERTFGRHAGEVFVAVIEADGFARPKPVEFVAGKQMPPIEIELKPAAPATIRGRVVDAAGKPIAGVPIGLVRELFGAVKDRGWPYFALFENLPKTDADGRFSITGMPVGTRFSVMTGKSGTNRPTSDWRTIEQPGDVELPDLTLRPGVGVLAGVVVDDGGRPIPGARVSQFDRFGRLETVTDADGKFRLEGLPDRPILLRAKADDFELWQQRVTDGKADVKIVLQRAD